MHIILQGYSWAGVQYGYECWCGALSEITNVIKPENDATEDECDTLCPGYSYEYCGGYYRMAVYHTCKFHKEIFNNILLSRFHLRESEWSVSGLRLLKRKEHK